MSTIHVYHHNGNEPYCPGPIESAIKRYKAKKLQKQQIREFDAWVAGMERKAAAKKALKAAKKVARSTRIKKVKSKLPFNKKK